MCHSCQPMWTHSCWPLAWRKYVGSYLCHSCQVMWTHSCWPPANTLSWSTAYQTVRSAIAGWMQVVSLKFRFRVDLQSITSCNLNYGYSKHRLTHCDCKGNDFQVVLKRRNLAIKVSTRNTLTSTHTPMHARKHAGIYTHSETQMRVFIVFVFISEAIRH